MKIPVVIRKDYTVFLGHTVGHNFIHCDVYRWTATVAKELRKDAKTLLALSDSPTYALHDPKDEKHRKFLEMFGFTYHATVTGHSGEPCDLYVSKGKE